jgi:hypothetical protein
MTHVAIKVKVDELCERPHQYGQLFKWGTCFVSAIDAKIVTPRVVTLP